MFCLELLKDTKAEVFRVEPIMRNADDIWDGFGNLGPDELNSCFAARRRFSPSEIKLGSDLWHAFRLSDHASLKLLAENDSPCFSHLKEVCEAALELDSRPKEILKKVTHDGGKDFNEVFSEFTKRAGVYGFGDSQVKRILESI